MRPKTLGNEARYGSFFKKQSRYTLHGHLKRVLSPRTSKTGLGVGTGRHLTGMWFKRISYQEYRITQVLATNSSESSSQLRGRAADRQDSRESGRALTLFLAFALCLAKLVNRLTTQETDQQHAGVTTACRQNRCSRRAESLPASSTERHQMGNLPAPFGRFEK